MGLAMEGTLIMPVLLIVIVAVIILIAIMRSASKSKGMLARQCPYCKNDSRAGGEATATSASQKLTAQSPWPDSILPGATGACIIASLLSCP